MLKSDSFFQRFLGNFTGTAWTESEAMNAIGHFQSKLEDISKEIKKRNEYLEVPYTYLLPERIPCGSAI